MRKTTRIALLAPVLVGAATCASVAQAAVTLVSSVRSDPTGYSFTPTKVVTFDSVLSSGGDFSSQGFLFAGSGSLVTGSKAGRFKAPTGDTSRYLSTGTGTETVSFGGQTLGKFGFYWGSVDAFNTVTFSLNNVTVGTFTGSSVMNTQNGSDSTYVSFAGAFNQVAFKSTRPSFELDNVAVGDVPEPGTWIMMILGLAGLGLFAQRKKATLSQSNRPALA